MQCRTDPEQTPDRNLGGSAPEVDGSERQLYVAPALERLGSWSVLTLAQSVGIALFQSLLNDVER